MALGKDKYAEVNEILDACRKEVAVEVRDMKGRLEAQRRKDEEGNPKGPRPIVTAAHIEKFAEVAINRRTAEVLAACRSAVAAQVEPETEEDGKPATPAPAAPTAT